MQPTRNSTRAIQQKHAGLASALQVTPSFRDDAKRRTRNPYTAALRTMDSGLAACAAPRNDNVMDAPLSCKSVHTSFRAAISWGVRHSAGLRGLTANPTNLIRVMPAEG